MIRKFNSLILTLVIFFTNIQTSYAQDIQWGPADIMEVTFRKLELCRGSNALFWQLREDFIEMNEKVLTDEYCNDPIVIGSGDETFDIASVEEKKSAGNYGNLDNLPPGETFTHVRLTVDRKFTIRNKLDENGKGIATKNGAASTNNCSTQTLTDRNFGADLADSPQNGGTPDENGDWTEENYKYMTIPATPNGAVPSKMNVYYTKGQTENQDGDNFGEEGGADDVQWNGFCQNEQCSAWAEGPWWYCYTEADCGSGLNKTAVGMSIPRKEGTAFQYDIPIDDIILIFKLRRPYTTSEKAAVMDIAFGTQKGVSANASGATGFCSMRMGWLNVFIRMKDARAVAGRDFQ